MSNRTALITGITGQDGAVLAALLLEKNYRVVGLRPYAASDDLDTLRRAGCDPILVHGDLTDSASLCRALDEAAPDEIYNLGAMSHVHVSFALPELTANINALGPVRLLEAMRTTGLGGSAHFYQASSSEMFGNAPAPQNENTTFAPCSPYGIAKLSAYWSTRQYREGYGFHASNGILFNHESPLRGEMFVTRKITRAVGEFLSGRQEPLMLGNLDGQRDWGHARDYMKGAWMMLQQSSPGDYVLASGVTRTVRDFATAAFACRGWRLAWEGEGVHETGRDAVTGRMLVKVDPALYRPREIDCLVGDAAKARRVLGWTPDHSFEDLVAEMVEADAPQAMQRRYG